jgi:DNA-binding GntR family transcriptional regulator
LTGGEAGPVADGRGLMTEDGDGQRPGEAGSLADLAVGTIRDRILDLTLAPGSRIDDRELMERFGVSRTPAREALNRLMAEGLVQFRPNRGAFVRPLDVDDVRQFFDAYYVAERAVGHFCRFDDPALVADLLAIQEEHEAAVAAYRFLEVSRRNAELHLRIARATGNPHLQDFAARIHNLARRLAVFVYRVEFEDRPLLDAQQRHIVAEHHAIIAAIALADRERLVGLLTAHAGRFQTRLTRFLDSRQGAEFAVV